MTAHFARSIEPRRTLSQREISAQLVAELGFEVEYYDE